MLRVNQLLYNQLTIWGLANVPPAIPNLVAADATFLAWSNNGAINANVIEHLASYLNAILAPPNVSGPYEINPYIIRYTKEFDLSRRYLLLGTCPPNSYLNNIPQLVALAAANPNVGLGPLHDFYYGNMETLWKYFGLAGINLPNILQFLSDNSIAISDVILGAQRKVFSSAADNNYFNILPNEKVCKIFSNESSIETVLFTSGSLRAYITYPASISALQIFIKIISQYCNYSNLQISGVTDGNGIFHPFNAIGIQAAIAQQNGHIIWYIRCNEKVIRIINLPTPANPMTFVGSDFFYNWLVYKATQNNLPIPPQINRVAFMNLFPNVFVPPYTTQFRSEVYQMAINIHNQPFPF